MDQFIEKNVDKIVSKVNRIFSEKIGPFIEKTIYEQKASLVQDFLSQIKTSYVRELNGNADEGVDDTRSDEDDANNEEANMKSDENRKVEEKLKVFGVKNDQHIICYIDSEVYEYDKMRELTDRFNKWLDGNDGKKRKPFYAPPTFDDIKNFTTELKTGEYLTYIYYTLWNDKIYKICMFTNFGSYFSIHQDRHYETKNYDYEIPYQILKGFIEASYMGNPPFVIKDIDRYDPNNFNISIFTRIVEHFRKYWVEYPLIGYKAEMLKKENEKIKEEVEKTKEKHEKIKHMYETLELKDQYYKAVELLKQNKSEREALEQTRKDLVKEREKQEKEIAEEYEKLNQKAKKLRQIEDIDKEFSKLALMKQKLEKKKQEFQKEKQEFDDLKNSLMEDSDS